MWRSYRTNKVEELKKEELPQSITIHKVEATNVVASEPLPPKPAPSEPIVSKPEPLDPTLPKPSEIDPTFPKAAGLEPKPVGSFKTYYTTLNTAQGVPGCSTSANLERRFDFMQPPEEVFDKLSSMQKPAEKSSPGILLHPPTNAAVPELDEPQGSYYSFFTMKPGPTPPNPPPANDLLAKLQAIVESPKQPPPPPQPPVIAADNLPNEPQGSYYSFFTLKPRPISSNPPPANNTPSHPPVMDKSLSKPPQLATVADDTPNNTLDSYDSFLLEKHGRISSKSPFLNEQPIQSQAMNKSSSRPSRPTIAAGNFQNDKLNSYDSFRAAKLFPIYPDPPLNETPSQPDAMDKLFFKPPPAAVADDSPNMTNYDSFLIEKPGPMNSKPLLNNKPSQPQVINKSASRPSPSTFAADKLPNDLLASNDSFLPLKPGFASSNPAPLNNTPSHPHAIDKYKSSPLPAISSSLQQMLTLSKQTPERQAQELENLQSQSKDRSLSLSQSAAPPSQQPISPTPLVSTPSHKSRSRTPSRPAPPPPTIPEFTAGPPSESLDPVDSPVAKSKRKRVSRAPSRPGARKRNAS